MRAARSISLRWRKPSLLTSFGLLGAIPLALLALALGISLHRIIEQRALESTRSQAVFTATVGVSAYFGSGATVSANQLLALQNQVRRLRNAGQLSGFQFWTPAASFTFGSVPHLAGTPQLERARAGQTVSWVQHDKLLVDVPIYLTQSKRPTGVLGVALPYALVSRRVEHDTRVLYLIVLGGFALLYAVLFPIVSRASRKLRQQAQENERLARHDALTGLPNRMYFQELLDQGDRVRPAAIVVDLDAFKAINDAYGHHTGDALLTCVGKRLRETVRETDVVARIGGDEFAILVPGGVDERAVEALSQRIVDAVSRPVVLDGIEISVRASVGASLPGDTEDRDEVIKRADRAMYSAKKAGGGVHRLLGAGAA